MTNKNKIINQAQKFITKGQWDKAIKELQKLIAEDPKDVRTLLKLGDVHSKKGDREAATRVYRQVAESYSEQGFFLKAVAVYKQILKHDPKHLEVTFKLAELYEHLGLTSEAMGQYQVAAQIQEESGQVKAALDILRRMVELDAENVASRIKLAESYSREGMMAEAVGEFEKAAEVLKRQNRTDDYLKVAERLVYHAPDRYDLLRDLAKLYLKRADAKRALAKLQVCFKANPKDIETLNLLAQAFSDLGQTQKTIFVYKELQNVYRELGQLPDVARVQGIINQLEGQGRGFSETSPVPHGAADGIFSSYGSMPADAGAQSLSAVFGSPAAMVPASGPQAPASPPFVPSLAPRPGPITPQPYAAAPPRAPSLPPPPAPRGPSMAPRPLAPPAEDIYDGEELLLEEPVPASSPVNPPAPPREPDIEQISKILTETDVYVKYGLRDKALEHLRRIFQIDVDNLAAYAKMREIYLSLGDTSRAAEAVANMIHVHARRGDADALTAAKAELVRLAPGHPLLAGGLPGGMAPHSADESLSIDIDEDSGVFEMVDFAEGAELDVDSGSIEFEAPEGASGDIVGELAFEPAEEMTPEAMPTSSPHEQDWSASMSEDGGVPFDEERTVHLMDEPSLAAAAAADLGLVFSGPQVTASPTPRPAVQADNPVASGDLDFMEVSASQLEPLDTSIADEDPFGGNVVRLDPTGSADALIESEELVAAYASEEITGETLPRLSSVRGEAQSEDSGDVGYEDELAEVQFLLDQGLREEALEAVQAILDEAPHHKGAQALLEDLLQVSEPTAETPAINGASTLTTTAPDEPIDEQAAADHHDQGMLFMDLGRIDDAIKEFQQAARSPSRTVGALEMIGHCLVQQGQFDTAIEYFALALESGADGYAATNIKYEIGNALEASGDTGGATRWFRACYAADPTHRDVTERLTNLGANPEGAPNGSHPPPAEPPRRLEPSPSTSKKAKISYL
ncbi:MAG: tetratricopeptide repeat protein [Deltaproteobacteria bacterium]|nr:tetratricopeptide repeat protein [Deltaproteobacteria bacterium]